MIRRIFRPVPMIWNVQGRVSAANCRDGDEPRPARKEAVLPDYFIVDYVRVFDEVKD